MDKTLKTMASFGTIVQIAGKKYVFFAGFVDIVYLALILEGADGRDARSALSNMSYPAQRKIQKLNLCLVALTTEEYKDCAVTLRNLDSDISRMQCATDGFTQLNSEDIKNIKNEILISADSMPQKLLDYVKSLDKHD